ncbi:hypothetical protein LG299_02305 [Microbacterium lacus]
MDEAKLLAFLRDRIERVGPLLAQAIYAGLITRIERGQFRAQPSTEGE